MMLTMLMVTAVVHKTRGTIPRDSGGLEAAEWFGVHTEAGGRGAGDRWNRPTDDQTHRGANVIDVIYTRHVSNVVNSKVPIMASSTLCKFDSMHTGNRAIWGD